MDLKIRKVLYTVPFDISLPNGPGVNEREFVLSLHRVFGDNVHLLISNPQKYLDEFSKYNVTFLKKCDNNNPLPFFAHQIDLYRKASKLLRTGNYDLIVARIDLLPLGLAFLLYKCPNVNLAIKTFTGYPRNFLRSQKGIKWLIGRFIAPINEFLLVFLTRKAIAIDACTYGHVNGMKENLKIDSEKILLVENAANVDRFKLSDKAKARTICGLSRFKYTVGFVGGLPWERGGIEMIMVAPKLIQKYDRIGFVVVGGGEGLYCLCQMAKDYGVADHFVFPGIVPYDEVPNYISAFDVGIAFDRVDKTTAEGNSNQKIRQYLASGVPVVATSGGSEFLAENKLGTIIEKDNLEQIEQALDHWLGLEEKEKRGFEQRAVAYARLCLSTHKMLEKRINFWNERLAVKSGIC